MVDSTHIDLSRGHPLYQKHLEHIVIHRLSLKPYNGTEDEDLTGERLVSAFRDLALGTGGTTPYHALVRQDGEIDQCLPLTIRGAHAHGYNAKSLGIAVAGRTDLEYARRGQVQAIIRCVTELWPYAPRAEVVGHTDLPGDWKGKVCPGKFLPVHPLATMARYQLDGMGWELWEPAAAIEWIRSCGWVV